MALGLFEQIAAINTRIKRLCCKIDACCNAGFNVTEVSLLDNTYTISEQGWYIVTAVDEEQTNTLAFSSTAGLDGKRVIVTNRGTDFITVTGTIPEYQGFGIFYIIEYIPAGYTYEFIFNETTGYWSCLSPTAEPVYDNINGEGADFLIKVPGIYQFTTVSGVTGYTVNFPAPEIHAGTTITIINSDMGSSNDITFGGLNAVKIIKPNGTVISTLPAGTSYTFKSIYSNWVRVATGI